MIIAKTDNGYQCRVGDSYFMIPPKAFYTTQKAELEALKEPTTEELIEIGRQSHPFYRSGEALENINNQLAEIEAFENQ